MKQIKGKIDFVVIPVTDNKEERVVSFEGFELYKFVGVPWFYLSSIKESEANLFVGDRYNNCAWRDYEHVKSFRPDNDDMDICLTAKESLVSLLKANDCWIKEWKEIPISMHYTPEYGCQKYPQECYESDLKSYNKTPDDFLIIKIQ